VLPPKRNGRDKHQGLLFYPKTKEDSILPRENRREKHQGSLFYPKGTEERNTKVFSSTQREQKRETLSSSVLPKENQREKHQGLQFYPKRTEETNSKALCASAYRQENLYSSCPQQRRRELPSKRQVVDF